MSFFQRLVLSIRSRCGNASKLQRISVISLAYSSPHACLQARTILAQQDNNRTTGDANLTYLKDQSRINAEIGQTWLASTEKQPSYTPLPGKESGGFFD